MVSRPRLSRSRVETGGLDEGDEDLSIGRLSPAFSEWVGGDWICRLARDEIGGSEGECDAGRCMKGDSCSRDEVPSCPLSLCENGLWCDGEGETGEGGNADGCEEEGYCVGGNMGECEYELAGLAHSLMERLCPSVCSAGVVMMEMGGTGIDLDRGSLSVGVGALATMTGGRAMILEGVKRGDSEGDVLRDTEEGEVEREADAAVPLLVGALSDSSSSSSLSSSLVETMGESISMAISSLLAFSSETLAASSLSSSG